jgi:hypothetical protein
MSQAILGIAFLIFGAASVADALRIRSTIRLRGTLDYVGPDGYLIGVGVLLLIVGALLIPAGVMAYRRARVNGDARTAEEGGYAHFALIAAMLAYAVAMPVLGYAASTLAFLIAVFRIMGVRSWTRTIVGSVVLSVVFFVSFTVVADLPLPSGWHGLG